MKNHIQSPFSWVKSPCSFSKITICLVLKQPSFLVPSGKATKKPWKDPPMLWKMGIHQLFRTGPISIANCVCLPEGMSMDGWRLSGKDGFKKNYRRDMTLLRFPVDFWDDNFYGLSKYVKKGESISIGTPEIAGYPCLNLLQGCNRKYCRCFEIGIDRLYGFVWTLFFSPINGHRITVKKDDEHWN